MSKKRIRARRMITDSSGIDPRQNFMQGWVPSAISANGMPTQSWPHPVYVLPATAEAYEQMVEQMERAWHEAAGANFGGNMTICVKRQLRAIGITPPKKGRT